MLSIVIPTLNRPKVLSKNLEILSRINEKNEVVVIIDGGKTEETKKAVKRFSTKLDLKIVENKKNIGTPMCWNEGIKNAIYQNILLLNDDSFIADENYFVKKLLEDLKEADIVGTKIVPETKKTISQQIYGALIKALGGYVEPYNGKKRGQVLFVNGCMGLNKKVFEKVKFNPVYTGNSYREESDFQLNAKREGFKIIYDPHLVVEHLTLPRGGQREHLKDDALYWNTRNHLIFLRNYSNFKRRLNSFFYLLLMLFQVKSFKRLQELRKAVKESLLLSNNLKSV